MITTDFLTGDLKEALMAAIIVTAIMIFLIVYMKIDVEKDKKMIKDMYCNHSVKVTAKILEIQEFYTNKNFHFLFKIKVAFYFENTHKTCIVKTNHLKIRDYAINQELLIFIIPEYIAYQEKRITKKQLFQELGLKFNVSQQGPYQSALIEEDYYHIIENF